MAHLKNPMLWLYGLVAAVFGAFWGAVESGVALPIIDSKAFNYGEELHKTLKGVAIFAALKALSTAATYLKRSPLPAVSENGNTTTFEKPEDLQK